MIRRMKVLFAKYVEWDDSDEEVDLNSPSQEDAIDAARDLIQLKDLHCVDETTVIDFGIVSE